MIAFALFVALLVIAALLCVILRLWDLLGVERRRADMLADQIAADEPEDGDWSKAETDRITKSVTEAKPMRPLAILLCLALLAPLTAADAPPQLDPAKPRDAVQIVEILTRDLTLPRVQAQALVLAIQTLAVVVERDAKATAAAQTVPAVKPED